LKIVLPAAMSEYYLIAGRLDQINKSHNILFTPAGLYIKDGHLWFMEENQAVVHWGIQADRLAEEDPMVYQRVNEEGMKWYSQRLRFSKFLTRVFDWQAGFASAPK